MDYPRYTKLLFILFVSVILTACSSNSEKATDEKKEEQATVNIDDWTANKGVGPIKLVSLEAEINTALSEEGRSIFVLKCSACHKVEKRYIGPSPQDILDRRTPEWVMNMILNPDGMVAEDPIAKKLLIDFNGTPMANQNLTEEEARAVLEYFRTLKSN